MRPGVLQQQRHKTQRRRHIRKGIYGAAVYRVSVQSSLYTITMQQSIDGGFTAAEPAIEFGRVFGTAAFEDIVAERVCSFGIEYTVFPEYAESVCIQYLGPLVAVVSGSIPSGENVAELG